jgi:hypothetical protein
MNIHPIKRETGYSEEDGSVRVKKYSDASPSNSEKLHMNVRILMIGRRRTGFVVDFEI